MKPIIKSLEQTTSISKVEQSMVTSQGHKQMQNGEYRVNGVVVGELLQIKQGLKNRTEK